MVISPNKWELDVQGYLNVCNISDSTPRQQIRDFAKGVNDLGLWNSMVCWPLRSSQNYGSGTTAFSLGGLGTFNGTLTNGPVWAVDGTGVTFDGTNDQIVVSTLTTGLSYSTFAVARTTSAVSELRVFGYTEGGVELGFAGSSGGIEAFLLQNTTPGAGRGVAVPLSARNRWFSAQSVFASGTSISRFLDGASKATTSTLEAPASTTGLQIGCRYANTLFWDGNIAAVAHFSGAISDAQAAGISTLYRDTLGQGLTGLP
jgi:hypothetical protein